MTSSEQYPFYSMQAIAQVRLHQRPHVFQGRIQGAIQAQAVQGEFGRKYSEIIAVDIVFHRFSVLDNRTGY
jgi:hypothetical protein